MTPRKAFTTATTLSLFVFELLALAIQVFFPYLQDPGVVSLNTDIYTLLEPLSVVLLLGLLYTWLVRIGVREVRSRSVRFDSFIHFLSEPFRNILSSIRTLSLSDSAQDFAILSYPRLLLGVSVVVSSLLAYIPYRPDINPTETLVGIDSPLYVGWINQMLARPVPEALQYSFVTGLEGSRPLLLIPLYAVATLGASTTMIIEYLPIILAPLLSLSTYTFVRYGQGSRNLAGLAALFTPVSFYLTVGLWGGYYANMLGLVFAYLFMTVLLVFSKTPTIINYTAMFLLSVALFLTHPWTWVLIVAVSLVFSVSLWRKTHSLRQLKAVAGIIVGGLILDITKSLVFATSTVAADVATKSPAGLGVLLGFWNNLVEALLYTHGGIMANWLIIGLGVFAVMLLRGRDQFEHLLALWIIVPSIPLLVLNSYSQARILYDLPFPTLASVATISITTLIRTKDPRASLPAFLLILFASASYAIQAILQL